MVHCDMPPSIFHSFSPLINAFSSPELFYLMNTPLKKRQGRQKEKRYVYVRVWGIFVRGVEINQRCKVLVSTEGEGAESSENCVYVHVISQYVPLLPKRLLQ